jgi:predicted component of type VI protein secretion system
MQARLHLVKGNPKGKQVEIPTGTLTVGRAEDSDLIIASTRVSRHHCEIVNDDKRLVVRDKGSGNGTLVNGVKVAEQVLGPGDEVQIGPLTFAVEIDGRRERPAAPKAAPAAKPPAPAKPAGSVRPPAQAAPRPLAKAAPAPAVKPGQPKGPAMAPKKGSPQDILASLERLAGPRKPGSAPPAGQKKGDDVLEISDNDLLDTDKT